MATDEEQVRRILDERNGMPRQPRNCMIDLVTGTVRRVRPGEHPDETVTFDQEDMELA